MFKGIFGVKKTRPAVEFLEERGVNVTYLTDVLGNVEQEILFSFIEQQLMNEKIEILDAPLLINTRLGTIPYPLIVRKEGKVIAYLVWPDEWDADTAREMLALFGILKKKAYLDASFKIISPHEAPSIIKYFADDKPRNRFHLLNLVDLAVERVGGSKVKIFIKNFKESFNYRLIADIESLKKVDSITTRELKPVTTQILYSEPVKATLYLLKAYLEQVMLTVTRSIYSTKYHRKVYQTEGPVMEYSQYYFSMDYRGKVYHEFAKNSPVNLAGFTDQIGKLLDKPSFIPDQDSFPFFQWVLAHKDSTDMKKHPRLEKMVKMLNQKRIQYIPKVRAGFNVTASRIFLCGECEEYFSETIQVPDFPVFTLVEFRQKAHSIASYEGDFETATVKCPKCGKESDYNSLRYQLFGRYMPDVGFDLQYHLDRTREDRLVGSWYAVSYDGEIKYLGHDISDEDLYSVIKRYISTVPLWRSLFKRSIEQKSIDMTTVEDYYHLIVVPPIAFEKQEKQLSRMIEPLKISGRDYRQFNLLDLADSGMFDKALSFHNWLAEYAHLVVNGAYKAAVFFGLERFREKLHRELQAHGLEYEEGKNFVYTVRRGGLTTKMDVPGLIPEILHNAAIPPELIKFKVSEAAQRLNQIDIFLRSVRSIAGKRYDLKYVNRDKILVIRDPKTKRIWKIDVIKTKEKCGVRGKRLEGEIRAQMGLAQVSLERCSCGKNTYTTLKLRSRKWVEEISETEMSGLIAKNLGNDFVVFFKECEDGHQNYIAQRMLKKWNMSISELKKHHRESLPLSAFNVDVFTSTIKGHPIMGIVGKDAASIGLQRAWIRRVIDRAPYILPRECRVEAPTANVLIISLEDTPADVIKQFRNNLLRKVRQKAGDALHFTDFLDLPQRGVGRIHVESINEL